jgi:hypothetical protein
MPLPARAKASQASKRQQAALFLATAATAAEVVGMPSTRVAAVFQTAWIKEDSGEVVNAAVTTAVTTKKSPRNDCVCSARIWTYDSRSYFCNVLASFSIMHQAALVAPAVRVASVAV